VKTATKTRSDEELVSRLRLATLRLARRLRREADAGITPTLLSAMSVLARHGSMTVSALAEAEGVQPPSMTAAVARMESSGLIAKTADESDRRVQRVSLTADGEKLVKKVRSRKNAYLARKLRSLDADDVKTLERAVGILEQMLEEES
jgi:DNA-binding MarR family transcriptional regulator